MSEQNPFSQINDGISGAHVIAANALAFISWEAEHSRAKDRSAFFQEINKKAERISKKLWFMGGVHNSLMQVLRESRLRTRAEKDIAVLKRVFAEQLASTRRANEVRIGKTAKNAARLFQAESSVFVFSNSATVLHSLQILQKMQSDGFIIHTVEAKPGGEGLVFAKTCAKMGFKVMLYPDLNLKNAIANADLIVVGADRLLCREFFNKAGTEIVLDYAAKYGKETVIVTDQSKILKLSDFLVGNLEMEHQAIYDLQVDSVEETNVFFERVPYTHVNRISSDLGNFEFADFHVRFLE
jgi:translation initiation factor 2B subunit (eIF-2B alpha/beta/delta family)